MGMTYDGNEEILVNMMEEREKRDQNEIEELRREINEGVQGGDL